MKCPPPGSILAGKYRVERELGQGGMGLVLEATHLALEQRVALKLLKFDAGTYEESVARFLRETRVAARLPAEHVARALDAGTTESGVPYLAMELLEGHDLAAEIEQRGSLGIEESVDAVLEASAGVAEAHAMGLVHRDLKPANLFLARQPKGRRAVKVLDFGLTKAPREDGKDSITATGAVFGTPQYMSPEQLRSTKDVDARTDQHALAMILYECLTGRPPFSALQVTELVVLIATTPPPSARDLRPEVPPGLDHAIVRAMAKRPEDRFPDLSAFAAAIAPFGGERAARAAALVAEALSPEPAPPAVPEPAAPGDTASFLPGADPTTRPRALPEAAPAAAIASITDLTSSADPIRLDRRRRRRALGIAGAALAAGVAALLGFLLFAGPAVDPSPDHAAAEQAPGIALALSASAPAPVPNAAEPTADPAPQPACEPNVSAAGMAATASASATAKAAPPPPARRPPSPKRPPTPKKPGTLLELYGDREKK